MFLRDQTDKGFQNKPIEKQLKLLSLLSRTFAYRRLNNSERNPNPNRQIRVLQNLPQRCIIGISFVSRGKILNFEEGNWRQTSLP